MLYGFARHAEHDRVSRSIRIPTSTSRPPTGGAAASYELNVTDQSFRFPQTWRTNIGVDRRLPWGLVGTLDYIYNRDLNAPVYINANLPAAQVRLHRRRQPAALGRDGGAILPGIRAPGCAARSGGSVRDALEQRARATRSPRTT